MHRLTPFHNAFLVASVLLAACGSGSPDTLEEQELRCWPDCGSNSPKINSLEIGDVRLANGTSSDVKLLYIESPLGAHYTLTTNIAEELAAAMNGTILYAGGDLIGWKLWFQQGSMTYHAEIVGISFVESPIPGNRSMIVYSLQYLDLENNRMNVCPGHAPGEPVVTVIRGETYDRDAKTINEVGPDWMTLACEREAAYKTKLLNYGPTTSTPGGAPVGSSARNATLKMITADYCGTGRSFTEQDTEVRWADAAHTINDMNYVGPLELEAYWTEERAVCLNTLRRPEKEAEVELECEIPRCDEVDLGKYASHIVWVTHVPPPPEETTGGEEGGESDTGEEE